MGMLDRLLGDLVASSTNLPPHVTRGLIRKAGGSKLLLAGGAALAGAFVAQQMQARSAQAAAQPAVPPPPPPGAPPFGGGSPGAGPTSAAAFTPPLPPPAAAGPAAELGWAPPPLPPELGGPAAVAGWAAGGGEESEDAGEIELPPGLLFPVVRTMVAAALADGELEPAERDAIFAHLESGELAPSEVQQVRRDLVLPATAGELAAMLPDPQHGDLLYRFAFLTLRADGQLEPHESAWLAGLGGALGLDAARRQALEREILG